MEQTNNKTFFDIIDTNFHTAPAKTDSCTFEKDTGKQLFNRQDFFKITEHLLQKTDSPRSLCMVSIDIENFKLFNEWHGWDAGDRLIKGISNFLKNLPDDEIKAVGYFGNDDFALLLPYDEDRIQTLYQELLSVPKDSGEYFGFLPALGVYEITDKKLSAAIMYDRAEIARISVRNNYNTRIQKFDTNMLSRMESNYVLLSDIKRALKENEITFFLQPKYNMETGKITGAEALVRWISKEKGLIVPGTFIPVLEKTGLIAVLDSYLWEEVCKWQRSILDRGMTAIPVSVNVSRADLFFMDVPTCFSDLIHKYELDPKLIEIEITESVYAEDMESLSNIVSKIRESGFRVLMDDFGSAYSSLNILKDIDVDVLKIDMRFLHINEGNAQKGIRILEAVHNMARLIGIHIIAEGVENAEQIAFLMQMGCTYGQGYYFSRPVPIPDFEKLLTDTSNLELSDSPDRKIRQIYLKNLLNEDMFSEVMINNMLGAVIFYEVYENTITVRNYNPQYASLLGITPFESETILRFGDQLYEEDAPNIFQMFKEAKRNRNEGGQCDLRRRLPDGADIWLHLRTFFLMDLDGHDYYYSSVNDRTELVQKTKLLSKQNQVLECLNKDASLSELNLLPCGLFQSEADGGHNFAYISNSLLSMLGYSRQTFTEKFHNCTESMVYKKDRERIQHEVESQLQHHNYISCEYRIELADGSLKWIYSRGRIHIDAQGKRWFYVCIIDYDYLKEKYAKKH